MASTYWLKSVGADEDEMADDWADSEPEELSSVHFSGKGKPRVRPGDHLLYYAAGHERIIGIAEVFMPPTKDNGDPWSCRVRPRLMLSRISRSPSIDVLASSERDFRKSVKRQSHIELTKAEYVGGREALESAFDSGTGDYLSDWQMFETALRA